MMLALAPPLARHTCEECGSTFTRLQNLQRHRRSHAGLKPHECSQCGEQFARSDLVRRHQQQQHNGFVPPAAPKACKSCATSKTRCNRETPCARCLAKGLTCEPQDPTPSRAAPPSPPSSATTSTQQKPELIAHDAVYVASPAAQSPNELFGATRATAASIASATTTAAAGWAFGADEFASMPDFLSLIPDSSPEYFSIAPDPSLFPVHTHHESAAALAVPGPLDDFFPANFEPTFVDTQLSGAEFHNGRLWSENTFSPITPAPSMVSSASSPSAWSHASLSTREESPSSFSTAMIDSFAQLYMQHFNPHWPMFNPQGFHVSELYNPLAVAIACVGAMYDVDENSRQVAMSVILVQCPALHSEMARRQVPEEYVLSALQALLLYQFCLSFAQEERHRSLAMVHHGSLVQLLRQSKLLNAVSSTDAPTTMIRSRVVHGIFFLDALQPLIHGSPALLALHELALPLPGAPVDASMLTLSRALRDPRLAPRVHDASTATLVLVALLGQALEFGCARAAALGACTSVAERRAIADSLELRRQGLEGALHRWRSLWDTLPTCPTPRSGLLFENALPLYTVTTVALAPWTHVDHPDLEGQLRAFRAMLNDGNWCGVTWLFPPLV